MPMLTSYGSYAIVTTKRCLTLLRFIRAQDKALWQPASECEDRNGGHVLYGQRRAQRRHEVAGARHSRMCPAAWASMRSRLDSAYGVVARLPPHRRSSTALAGKHTHRLGVSATDGYYRQPHSVLSSSPLTNQARQHTASAPAPVSHQPFPQPLSSSGPYSSAAFTLPSCRIRAACLATPLASSHPHPHTYTYTYTSARSSLPWPPAFLAYDLYSPYMTPSRFRHRSSKLSAKAAVALLRCSCQNATLPVC